MVAQSVEGTDPQIVFDDVEAGLQFTGVIVYK
jgi:hypothetical protein